MTLISRRVEQSEWKKCVRFETLRVQPRCKLREGRDGRSVGNRQDSSAWRRELQTGERVRAHSSRVSLAEQGCVHLRSTPRGSEGIAASAEEVRKECNLALPSLDSSLNPPPRLRSKLGQMAHCRPRPPAPSDTRSMQLLKALLQGLISID